MPQEPAIKLEKRKAPELIGRFNWQDADIPVNGSGENFALPYDKVMADYLREVGAPGGTLTVYYKGKRVYSKGFGYADIDRKTPFTPNTASRISSVSKFLTQRAIESLIENGQLDADDKVADILKKGGIVPLAPQGKKADPRIGQITIQHLLDHKSGIRAGLNIADCTSDVVVKEMGFAKPNSEQEALGYILGLPLDSDPGKEDNYSNYGYALLGKIVQIVSGKSYEAYVREVVIKPYADPAHWFVTTARRADKRPTEPEYYSTRFSPTWDAFRWDILAGAGGWVVPTDELADFFQRVFPGKGWHYTLFGSYTGAVTVMRVHDNTLVYAASINYRRGNGPSDNDVLFARLEEATRALTLP